jgi:hypothetical protein
MFDTTSTLFSSMNNTDKTGLNLAMALIANSDNFACGKYDGSDLSEEQKPPAIITQGPGTLKSTALGSYDGSDLSKDKQNLPQLMSRS